MHGHDEHEGVRKQCCSRLGFRVPRVSIDAAVVVAVVAILRWFHLAAAGQTLWAVTAGLPPITAAWRFSARLPHLRSESTHAPRSFARRRGLAWHAVEAPWRRRVVLARVPLPSMLARREEQASGVGGQDRLAVLPWLAGLPLARLLPLPALLPILSTAPRSSAAWPITPQLPSAAGVAAAVAPAPPASAALLQLSSAGLAAAAAAAACAAASSSSLRAVCDVSCDPAGPSSTLRGPAASSASSTFAAGGGTRGGCAGVTRRPVPGLKAAAACCAAAVGWARAAKAAGVKPSAVLALCHAVIAPAGSMAAVNQRRASR